MKKTNYANGNILFWAAFGGILLFSVFYVFSGLTAEGIIEWDEARHGVNAYEMLQNRDYIVHTYNGEIDYWNVKPPLSMWAIALAYRIFGYNILSLRFFSALCLPVIVCVGMLFQKRFVGSAAALGTGLLFAVTGPRLYHLFRAGDPDALFFLFCFLTCVCLYCAIQAPQGNTRYLIGCGICTAFAFLTKAMHVAPLFAVLLCTLLITRKEKPIPARDLLLKLILPMAVPVILWVLWRFSQDGLSFFRHMFLLDVYNRVVSVVENHAGGPAFYLQYLYSAVGGWIFWGILCVIVFDFVLEITHPKKLAKDLPFIAVFGNQFFWPMCLFTIATTKIAWYIYPALIGLYFLAGYCVQRLWLIAADKKRRTGAVVSLAVGACMLVAGVIWRPVEYRISVNSDMSVFSSMEDFDQYAGYHLYYTSLEPIQEPLYQSWLLQAMFAGLSYREGGVNEYLQDATDALLLVEYTVDMELQSFVEREDLRLIAKDGWYAVCTR